jgi:crotonyl-CoA reductase
VVSSEAKADLCRRIGAELVINRSGLSFWDDSGQALTGNWSRFRNIVRKLAGGDPEIVFEHSGRDTFGISVLTAARGGTVVTCASTSGYQHTYDNRHLWMHVKRIVGSHAANYREACAANELVNRARIHPILSHTYPLHAVADAAHAVYTNTHVGKIGVLCLAPTTGMGVRDPITRADHYEQITLFQQLRA